MNRRSFAKNLTAGLLLAGLAPTSASLRPAIPRSNGRERMVRLGGPVFVKSDDPDELARAHSELGYRAAYCPAISLNDKDRITATIRAFCEQGVVLAEVGRWCNLLDPDPAQRKKNLDNVIEGLALAEALGALCCVDIAGSFNPKTWYGPHPENLSRDFFDAAVENARKIIDAVQPIRSKFCYEMMGWALPDSPDSYFKMIRAVDRKAFAAHLDPCNLINCPERYYQSTALLHECFRKLGPHIVSCHAKDLSWNLEMNLHFREVRPGEGDLDYSAYLRLISSLGQTPPLMLEHLSSAQEYDLAKAHLVKLGQAQGISM